MNRIIDVHTHMFNGHYVPLKDIFHYKFGLGVKVSGALAVIVNSLVNTKPGGVFGDDSKFVGWESFANYSRGEEDRVEAFSEYLMDSLSKKIADETSSYNPDKAFSQASSSEVLRALMVIVEEDAKTEGYDFSRSDLIEELTPNLIRKDALSLDVKRLNGLGDVVRATGLGALTRLLRNLGGHIAFVGKMLLHEEDLAEHLTGDNYRDEDKPALTVHLMMDMEPAYTALGGGSKPKLDFISEQIPRALDVARNANGKLLGFVAYDPHRGEEGLEVVKTALAAGYIGVKLYPPMGYLPNDFDRFSALYDYCSENAVPIMTHCTPLGFDAKKDAGFGLNSDPEYWAEVLARYNDLVLCFGHAGGGDYKFDIRGDDGTVTTKHFNGWYDVEGSDSQWEDELSYPRKIIALCQKYPNVYTDMSYLYAMIDDVAKRRAFVNRLKEAVGQKPNATYDFGHKMMYGSDWHMSQIVNRTNELLDCFQKIFSDNQDLEPYSDAFFFSNAVRYLRLSDYVERQEANNHKAHSPSGISHLKWIVSQA